MSKSVNNVMLLGFVGKDPEVRTTGGGTMVANFSLATSERSKGGDGNWADKTEWHNLVVFGKTAEVVRDYVHKGSKLYVEGKLQTRSWDDRDSGKKVYRTEVAVRELILLDAKREDGEQPYPPKSNLAGQTRLEQELDIPF